MHKANWHRLVRRAEAANVFYLEVKVRKFCANLVVRYVGGDAPQNDLDGAILGEGESVEIYAEFR